MVEQTKSEAQPAASPAASATPRRRGIIPLAIGIVLQATLAAGAAYGGARLGSARASGAPAAAAAQPNEVPGPTVTLEPFVCTVTDAERRVHAMRVRLAIELKQEDEKFERYVPRLRDATLSALRSMSFEDAVSPAGQDQLREELLSRYHDLGAKAAAGVLLTEFVVQ